MSYQIETSFCILVIIVLMQTCNCTIFRKLSTNVEPKLPEPQTGETRSVYYHEDTIAVIDSSGANITRCELVEFYDRPKRDNLLKKLSTNWSVPFSEIGFDEMLEYMNVCDELDNDSNFNTNPSLVEITKIFLGNIWSKLYGITPGTKWCGTGDIAENYHDLGGFRNLDRCCRAHDLCPVKILAYDNRYDIKNEKSGISKSHCSCDERFYQCLKNNDRIISNLIGFKYFDILRPQCIEDQVTSQNEKVKKIIKAKKWY